MSRCRLKTFLIWSSGGPLCSAEQSNLRNFRRRHHDEQFCEIILNFDQWFVGKSAQRNFLSRALAAILFIGVKPFM